MKRATLVIVGALALLGPGITSAGNNDSSVVRGDVALVERPDAEAWVLGGDWAFWPGKLVSDLPQSPMRWVDEAPFYYKVPGSLTREHLQPHQLENEPYGTFALRLGGLSKLSVRHLEIALGAISSASRVHIVTSSWETRAKADLVGNVSKEAGEEKPSLAQKYFEIDIRGVDEIFIIVEFSFHNDRLGGFFNSPQVFLTGEGTVARLRDFAGDAAMSGILILFALFHLVLYSRRREDTPSLWFGLFCFAMGIRLLAMSEVYQVFFGDDWTFRTATAIEYASISAGGIFGTTFVLALVPGQLYRLAVFAFAGIGTTLTAFALVSDTIWVTSSLVAFQSYAVTVLAVIVIHLLGKLKSSVNARYAFTGIGLLFLAVINDLLHANEIIKTDYVVPISVIVFVLVQSGLIGRNNARVVAERDRAQRDLLENYQKLDAELLRRESLLKANEELRQENRQAAEKLVVADKLATLGTLVAGVAHDIANPTGLIANTNEKVSEGIQEVQDFLEELVGDPEDQESQEVLKHFRAKFAELQERVARIELGARRIATINLAIRNQARQDSFEKAVPLRPIVDECLVVLGQRLKDIEVRVECDAAISLDCKRSELGQVLMNLLSNAADAVNAFDEKTQSLIAVRASSVLNDVGEPLLKLAISDSGPGIPIELAERVLEPFYTTKSVGVGTGLGMSIVSKIVSNHHGKVSVENCRELGGAAILIELPQRGVDEAEV